MNHAAKGKFLRQTEIIRRNALRMSQTRGRLALAGAAVAVACFTLPAMTGAGVAALSVGGLFGSVTALYGVIAGRGHFQAEGLAKGIEQAEENLRMGVEQPEEKNIAHYKRARRRVFAMGTACAGLFTAGLACVYGWHGGATFPLLRTGTELLAAAAMSALGATALLVQQGWHEGIALGFQYARRAGQRTGYGDVMPLPPRFSAPAFRAGKRPGEDFKQAATPRDSGPSPPPTPPGNRPSGPEL